MTVLARRRGASAKRRSAGGGSGPAWRSAGVSNTSLSTSHAVPKPAGLTVGDLILILFTTTSTAADAMGHDPLTNPSGFTLLGGGAVTGGGAAGLWMKVADAADVAASSFTFTTNGNTRSLLSSVAISGVDTADPIKGFLRQAQASAVNSWPVGPLTPDVAPTLLVGLWSSDFQTTTDTWSAGVPAEMTQRALHTEGTQFQRHYIATEPRANTDAVTRTATSTGTADTGNMFLVAVG